MSAHPNRRIEFATSQPADIAALKSRLPSGFLLHRLEYGSASLIRPPVDIMLLDLAHPIGTEKELLNRLAEARPKRAVILASDLRQTDGFPFGIHPVDRVRHHPKNGTEYRELAQCLAKLADPDADKKFSRAEWDERRKNLEVEFQSGRFFNFPAKVLEIDAAKIKRVRISRSGYEIVVEQDSGAKSVVPWDVVRHHCDPAYPHFRSEPDAAVADRVAANVKTLRRLRKISSYDLALKTGIARPNIARIESARTNPNLATIERLAKALAVPAARLIQ